MRIKGYVYNDSKAQYLRPVNVSENVNLTCYMTETKLNFRPAMPKAPSQMIVGFKSALTIYPGYKVMVGLAGWTSGAAMGIAGPDDDSIVVRDDLAVTGNSTFFRGSWREGCCYERHLAGWLNSTLVLTAITTITAGTTVSVVIPAQKMKPQCGMPGPYANTTMSVKDVPGRVLIAPRAVDEADAVGQGCSALDNCNGNGVCDHCTETCTCKAGTRAVDNSYRRGRAEISEKSYFGRLHGMSTSRPRRRRDPSRNIHVATAAAPRPASAK